jgi:hypothetical protein
MPLHPILPPHPRFAFSTCCTFTHSQPPTPITMAATKTNASLAVAAVAAVGLGGYLAYRKFGPVEMPAVVSARGAPTARGGKPCRFAAFQAPKCSPMRALHRQGSLCSRASRCRPLLPVPALRGKGGHKGRWRRRTPCRLLQTTFPMPTHTLPAVSQDARLCGPEEQAARPAHPAQEGRCMSPSPALPAPLGSGTCSSSNPRRRENPIPLQIPAHSTHRNPETNAPIL